jgi:hypothetical protein
MTERWRSYQWRKLMGVGVAEYDLTPALTVDWDLELLRVEQRVEKIISDRANRT